MALLLFILCFYWDAMWVWQVEYAIDLYEYSGRLMEVNIYHVIFCVFGSRFGSLDIGLSKYLPQDIFRFLFD